MNGITGLPSASVDPRVDSKSRFAPKLKPEVNRVPGNPFYPNGFVGAAAGGTVASSEARANESSNAYEATNSEFQRQVFEANLPVTQQESSQKVGTVLNTLA